MTGAAHMARFLALSSELAGFTIYELRGTGQAEAYLASACRVVGENCVVALLSAYAEAPAAGAAREAHLRRTVLGDPRLGPVARNIMKLWYLGIWYELPRPWMEAYGARADNTTFMVSADAYTEGLVWPAVGANPPGAKAPGYASWVGPPQIPMV